jgi:single-strand DNA-binding protein
MSRSLNVVHLIGNTGQDPEIRMTPNGTKVAKLSLATSREWKTDAGKKEKTEWHRITAFGKLADIIEQWVKKGDRLYIEGRIEYSQTEHEGATKYWTDIVADQLIMLGGTGGEERAPAAVPHAEDDGPPLPF